MTAHHLTIDDMLEPEPIEIDPRPCEWCGLTIDRHCMVDDGEGPQFYCIDSSDEIEREIMLSVSNLIRQWELADPRDRWRNTGEQPPRAAQTEVGTPTTAKPYRTPQSTIDAFWFVASLDNPDHLKRWLAEHPRDVATLQKLWEAKHACA